MSKPKHHIRLSECASRAVYREGRKPKAVKVYTVNQESQYLVVQGVPAVGATQDLIKLFGSHGDIEEHRALDDYPAEQFTEVYLIKYGRIQAARHAKRRLDDWSFYGGVLHVCYAPEYESVQETREKLQERRKAIAAKTRQYSRDGTYSSAGSQLSSHTVTRSDTTSAHGGEIQHSATDTTTNVTLHMGVNRQHHTQDAKHFDATRQEDNFGIASEYNSRNPADTHMKLFQNETHFQKTCYNQVNHSHASTSQTGSQTSAEKCETYNSHDQAQGTSQAETSEMEQIWLPPPPKQLRTGFARHRQLQNYEFAKVPTAQAVFPVNYDARIGHQTEESSHAITDKNSEQSEEKLTINPTKNTEESISKTMQEKIEDSLKSKSNMVIKDFTKKGSAPKFIPRQAQAKIKSTEKPVDKPISEIRNAADEANRQLRKDAFTLREAQGPASLGPESDKGPDPGEVSVAKTVKEIRKRISQISENKDHLNKKTKSTES